MLQTVMATSQEDSYGSSWHARNPSIGDIGKGKNKGSEKKQRGKKSACKYSTLLTCQFTYNFYS